MESLGDRLNRAATPYSYAEIKAKQARRELDRSLAHAVRVIVEGNAAPVARLVIAHDPFGALKGTRLA